MYHVGKISATKKCNHPSVSDRFQASRMDMASLLAAQQLLAGSGASSLSASQQQQLVGVKVEKINWLVLKLRKSIGWC